MQGQRVNATEIGALRRSVRISKLDRKTNDYIREKMDKQDTILDEITRKQLIWYGYIGRMDPTRLPKIMINLKPEGRKKRKLERWDIQGVTGGTDQTSGGCSLGHTIPI